MTFITANQVYRLLDAYLQKLDNASSLPDPSLNDEQNALLTYLRMDSIAEDNGFLTLIAQGYGDTLLTVTLSAYLHQWQLERTARLFDQARALYQQHGQDIQQQAAAGSGIDHLRQQFSAFTPIDEEYYLHCEDDFITMFNHVRQNFTTFDILPST